MNIYLIKNITNIRNNKLPFYYIGSDTKDRFNIDEYFSSSKLLCDDINYNGFDNFEKIILWRGSKEELNDIGYTKLTELEECYHVRFNVLSKYFYNQATANGKFCTEGRANYFYLDDPTKK